MGVVIRPPRPGDAEGLARASLDLAEQYLKLEPDWFRTPERGALVGWLTRLLAEPIPDRELWLVAELDGEAVGDAQAQLHEPITDAALQARLDAGRRRPSTRRPRSASSGEVSLEGHPVCSPAMPERLDRVSIATRYGVFEISWESRE